MRTTDGAARRGGPRFVVFLRKSRDRADTSRRYNEDLFISPSRFENTQRVLGTISHNIRAQQKMHEQQRCAVCSLSFLQAKAGKPFSRNRIVSSEISRLNVLFRFEGNRRFCQAFLTYYCTQIYAMNNFADFSVARITLYGWFSVTSVIIRGNLNARSFLHRNLSFLCFLSTRRDACIHLPFLTAALLMGATAFSSGVAGHLSRGENGFDEIKVS